jgi:hypothetical protein
MFGGRSSAVKPIAAHRAGLVPIAVFALAVFALGSAVHFAHHILDPDCDSGRTASSHACLACSGLHGAALTETAVAINPSAPSPETEVRAPECIAPIAAVRGPSAPRAPPAA